MSLEELKDGEVAALVTYLEMRSPPDELHPDPAPLSLEQLERPSCEQYRRLFRAVGARWLWFSRLLLSDERLASIIHDPAVAIFCVTDAAGKDVGMLELDFRQQGACELAFVGLVPELAGQGHGRWLLAEALRLAWREDVARVHVHTCSLDHPAALSAYCRAGFKPCGRAIERFADPRLLGVLPPDCAPQVPLLGTLASASPPSAS